MIISLNDKVSNLLENKNFTFSKASESKVTEIYQLFLERKKWFEDRNINQWGDAFFNSFSLNDLKEIINNSNYFVLEENGKVIAGFELADESKYWEDKSPSYYINKIVVNPSYKNIGSLIIDISKEIAIANKKISLRLDCRKDNEKLNQIYNNHGFKLVKYGQNGYYNYSLREMIISNSDYKR